MVRAMNWSTNPQDAGEVVDALGRASDACRNERYRAASIIRLPRRGRLLATGDLHDNPFHLDAILKLAKLDASADRHVILHELIHGENLINGMDFSYRMLVRLAELKLRYPDQVHPLLGNHELAQMSGAAVGKGAGDSTTLFNDALDFTFGDDAGRVREAIAGFIRSWPIALVTDSGVLCAHSLPRETAMDMFDKSLLMRELRDDDYESRIGSAYLMVWGRGHSAAHLDHLAELFGVKLFILGHERAETGIEPVGSRGVVLNSDHERGAALPIDLSAEPDRDQWMWQVIPLRAVLEGYE